MSDPRDELRRKLRAKIAGSRGRRREDGTAAAQRLVLSMADDHPELFGVAQAALQRPHAVRELLQKAATGAKSAAKDDDEEEAPPDVSAETGR